MCVPAGLALNHVHHPWIWYTVYHHMFEACVIVGHACIPKIALRALALCLTLHIIDHLIATLASITLKVLFDLFVHMHIL